MTCEDAFTAAVYRHRRLAFAWGEADCVRFWADCVQAITGRDPLAGLPAWSCPRSAVRTLRSAGFDSVTEFVASRFLEIEPRDLRRGDLATDVRDPQPLVSPLVVLGAEMINRDETRWFVLPSVAAVRAFRVS